MAFLVTGGTGALGRELVRLLREDGAEVFVLTRKPTSAIARALGDGGARMVAGDVTAGPSIGVSDTDAAMLRGAVTRVVHCAAETSFTLPIEQARAVNVCGTAAVLDFARTLRRVDAVACASTVYVAGTRTGPVLESDASDGAGHVNSYERSKHEMEQLARSAMRDLPVSLYRLSTIVGDSRTGAVTSLNAIHQALRLFYQGLAPMVPGELSVPVDVIPTDFAAPAMRHLVTRAFAPGRTYQLCAGARATCTLDELLALTVDAFERSRPAWRKRRVARPAVVDAATYALFVRSVEESGNVVLQRATQAVQAFAWQLAYPKTFDARHAEAALSGTGIAPPPVRSYWERIVEHCVETNWLRAADGAAA